MKNSISFKTRKQICAELGISPSTLRRKLQRLNIKLPAGDVSPKDQKKIYETFGFPPMVRKEDYTNL